MCGREGRAIEMQRRRRKGIKMESGSKVGRNRSKGEMEGGGKKWRERKRKGERGG